MIPDLKSATWVSQNEGQVSNPEFIWISQSRPLLLNSILPSKRWKKQVNQYFGMFLRVHRVIWSWHFEHKVNIRGGHVTVIDARGTVNPLPRWNRFPGTNGTPRWNPSWNPIPGQKTVLLIDSYLIPIYHISQSWWHSFWWILKAFTGPPRRKASTRISGRRKWHDKRCTENRPRRHFDRWCEQLGAYA